MQRFVGVVFKRGRWRFSAAERELSDAHAVHANLEMILDVQTPDGTAPRALQAKLDLILSIHGKVVTGGNATFGSQGEVFTQTLRLAKICLIIGIVFHRAVAHEHRGKVRIADRPSRDRGRSGYVPV